MPADKRTRSARERTGLANWHRCLAIVRASVRMKQAVSARDRLHWRCHGAQRMKLLSPAECDELDERLQPGLDEDPDEFRDLLDGLGVPVALDEIAPAGSPAWTCTICNAPQRSHGWRCPFDHRYCRDCMAHWAESAEIPTCPHEHCGYRLGEHDLRDLRVNDARLEAFKTVRSDASLAALQTAEAGAAMIHCSGAGCGAAIVLGFSDSRRRWECACGAPPVCTECGATPYHHHGQCQDVQTLRARWLAWRKGGRERYKNLDRQSARESTAQHKALKEAIMQHAERESDEEWKAKNCRLCPKCLSAVQKVDSSAAVVCGQRVHNNAQPGCGHRFSWKDAKPYRVGGAGTAPRPPPPPHPRRGAISGRGVRHLSVQCGLCGSGGKCIVGPRFQCIHCPSFSSCLKCEPRLATEHPEEHVFRIMFEDDIDWSQTGIVLAKGIRARIRRSISAGSATASVSGNPLPDIAGAPRGEKRPGDRIAGLEGQIKGKKSRKYILELPDNAGARYIAPEHLQPLLTQQQAERLLVAAPTAFAATPCAARLTSAAQRSNGV